MIDIELLSMHSPSAFPLPPRFPAIRYTLEDDKYLGKQCHSLNYAYTFRSVFHKDFAKAVYLVGSWDNWQVPIPFKQQTDRRYRDAYAYVLTVSWLAPYSQYKFQYVDLEGNTHWFTRVLNDRTVEDNTANLTVNASIAEEYRLDAKVPQSLANLCIRYLKINAQYLELQRWMMPEQVAFQLGLQRYDAKRCRACTCIVKELECRVCIERQIRYEMELRGESYRSKKTVCGICGEKFIEGPSTCGGCSKIRCGRCNIEMSYVECEYCIEHRYDSCGGGSP